MKPLDELIDLAEKNKERYLLFRFASLFIQEKLSADEVVSMGLDIMVMDEDYFKEILSEFTGVSFEKKSDS